MHDLDILSLISYLFCFFCSLRANVNVTSAISSYYSRNNAADVLAEQFVADGLATSTNKQYKHSWKRFCDAAFALNRTPIPVSLRDLKAVMASLAMESSSFSVVQKLSASVSHYHRLSGYPSPTLDRNYTLFLRGVEKNYFTQPSRVTPLSSQDLKCIFDSIIGEDIFLDSYYMVTLCSWRTVASIFLCFSSLARFDCTTHMLVEHLVFVDRGVFVTFPRSKTDQIGSGHTVFVAKSGTPYCPVWFLQSYLLRLNWEFTLSGGVGDYQGYLFPSLMPKNTVYLGHNVKVQFPENKPYSYNAALIAFRRHLSLSGFLNPLDFALHSPRRGGASEASNSGCPRLQVKSQGRWRSEETPTIYIDPDFDSLSIFSGYLNL